MHITKSKRVRLSNNEKVFQMLLKIAIKRKGNMIAGVTGGMGEI